MRLLKFIATDVHEYLNFNMTFRDDVNFIAGLNGSGKTTALKLIMAILTPDINTLVNTHFKSCYLSVSSNDDHIEISCNKENGGLKILVMKNNKIAGKYDHSSESRYIRIKNGVIVNGHFELTDDRNNRALNEIKELNEPMFLSLERRTMQGVREKEISIDIRNEQNDREWLRRTNDYNLRTALELIYNASSTARSQHSKLDKKLRDEIILASLATFNSNHENQTLPDSNSISEISKKYQAIYATLANLDLDIDIIKFKELYSDFLDKMKLLTNELASCKSPKDVFRSNNKEVHNAIYEWFTNQDQLKRIDKLANLVENYEKSKIRYYRDINKFEILVNNFLKETGKEVVINIADQPKIKINGKKKEISLLSSGESQILIMLAHLVLNKDLQKNGVLIIDEPEVSLHISWQDMFVESLQAASPDLQIILATHSPAIIGGRNEMYIPLFKDNK